MNRATSPVRHALVVDDEPLLRELAQWVLEQQGWEVTCCSDGQLALETLEAATTPFDLVVLDLGLPTVSGPEVLGTLWQRWPASSVLVVSGQAPADARRALGAASSPGTGGRLAILAKPFRLEQLAEAVERLLAQTPAS